MATTLTNSDLAIFGKWSQKQPYGALTVAGNHQVIENQYTGEIEGKLEELIPDPDQVARVEFIWDDVRGKRGAILVDTVGNVMLHVVDALLGYNGSGPRLSEAILARLGANKELFEHLNEAVWQQRPYGLGVFRNGPNKWSIEVRWVGEVGLWD